MSNSSLVNYTRLSPNYNPRYGTPIRKITIHHTAGIASVEQLGQNFSSPKRQGSANYGIGSDGRVGLYVEERNRAWTSGSPDNDYQAITIETSNDENGGQWHVSNKVFDKLIALVVDICKRNNIKELVYTGDANGNLTLHKFFQATACPGPYLTSKMPYIAETVNAYLRGESPMTMEEKQAFEELQTKVASLQSKLDEYENGQVYDNAAVRWAYIDNNLPAWAKPTIQKLYDKKILVGNEKGSLELSYLMMRILVILDRDGVFD